MDSQHIPQQPVSPLGSPEGRILRPEYASIPQRTSDDSTEHRREQRSRFQENIEPGLGIQMLPVASPKTPGTTHYRFDSTTKAGLFSPQMMSPDSRPPYHRTPDTMYSFQSNMSRRTDPMTERLIAHRATKSAQWYVHWRTPALMGFAFVMGVALALSQHFLYRSLHHKSVVDDAQKFRWVLYGRGLAYLSKVAFGGCVILVFEQRIWRTFRERALSVLAIDQLFGATEYPALFGNWELISQAPILCAIAVVFWMIPLATVVFSPGALTFGNYVDKQTLQFNVPVINFTAEMDKNWRNKVPYKDSNKRSVMYYNTTDKSGTAPGWFDYYDQPSAEVRRIALLLAYSNMDHPNLQQGARQEVCGGPYNCTFEQTFVAPGYQCDEIASGINDTGRLRELGSPINMSSLAPVGKAVYLADVNIGDYANPQNGTFQKGTGGVPVGDAPQDLGVFKSEPILWIGYSVNSTQLLKKDDPLALNWTHRFEPHILRCVHKETEYHVKWNFTEPFFDTTVTRKYLAPVVDTNFTLWENGTPRRDVDPQPAKNFVSPRTDVGLYKKTAAYHALGQMFRSFLTGHVDLEPPLPGPYYATVYSDITKTRLVKKDSEPKANLSQEIESFYSDMVLSLFSSPEMLAIGQENVTMYRSRIQSSFVYVPEKLWKCYAPVIFVSFIILLFGCLTIWEDGTTFSTGFSRILVTTRNSTLDDISRGACLGNDPFPMELMHTRLKFGVLNDQSDVSYMGGDGFQNVGHCAFGVASEVGPIRRGAPYAGSRKRRPVRKVGLKIRKPIRKEMEKADG